MNTKEIGKNLKKIRKSKKWTQEELAKISGISVTTIKEIEWGVRDTQVNTLLKIAECLNTTIDHLVHNKNYEEGLSEKIARIKILNEHDKDVIETVIDSIILKSETEKLISKK